MFSAYIIVTNCVKVCLHILNSKGICSSFDFYPILCNSFKSVLIQNAKLLFLLFFNTIKFF